MYCARLNVCTRASLVGTRSIQNVGRTVLRVKVERTQLSGHVQYKLNSSPSGYQLKRPPVETASRPNGPVKLTACNRFTSDTSSRNNSINTRMIIMHACTWWCLLATEAKTNESCVQPSTAAVNVTLLAFAADPPCCCAPCCMRRTRSISHPRGTQQQTRRTLLQRSTDGTDRQTTDGHPTVT